MGEELYRVDQRREQARLMGPWAMHLGRVGHRCQLVVGESVPLRCPIRRLRWELIKHRLEFEVGEVAGRERGEPLTVIAGQVRNQQPAMLITDCGEGRYFPGACPAAAA